MDHGLLVQQATGETQRQHICALTLEEDESDGPAGDFLAADWRRDLKVKHLKKARARLKAKIKNVSGRRRLSALAGAVAGNRSATQRSIGLIAKGENG